MNLVVWVRRAAKVASLSIIPAFTLYLAIDTYYLSKYGQDSCDWVLNTGYLTASKAWNPYGCTMHWYTKEDARKCMIAVARNTSHPNIILVGGDSRMRGFYTDLIDHFTYRRHHEFKQSDHYWQDKTIRLHLYFMWRSYVDGEWEWPAFGDVRHGKKPVLLIAGIGLWYNAFFPWEGQHLPVFKRNLHRWAKMINQTQIPILWRLQVPVSTEHEPKPAQKKVSDNSIALYNEATVAELKQYKTVRFWSTGILATSQLIEKIGFGMKLFRDWVHVCHATHEYEIQTFLNFYCNRVTKWGTCCQDYKPEFDFEEEQERDLQVKKGIFSMLGLLLLWLAQIYFSLHFSFIGLFQNHLVFFTVVFIVGINVIALTQAF